MGWSELPQKIHVQVDGGVGDDNVCELRGRGATLLVVASSTFAYVDPAHAYRGLVEAVA